MRSNKRVFRTGLLFFITGGLILLVERSTNSGISTLFGKLYCGERYLQAAGQMGDGTCGFNMDMVVGMASFLLCLIGIILLIIGLIQLIAQRKKK